MQEKMTAALANSVEEEKMNQLVEIISNQHETMRLLQEKIKECHAKFVLSAKRGNELSEQLNRVNNSKKKMEQLCRELQKQNKNIMQESRLVVEDEDRKRKELSARFQKSIDEVSAKMDEQGSDYVKALKENESLQQKLKTFLEQYEAREKHFENQLQAKQLTAQLAEAKLNHQLELSSREASQSDIHLEKLKQSNEREAALQAQLLAYSEKFDNVQETLTKSNSMFTSFRDEMNKMSKHIQNLEKENLGLRKKCAEYDKGAIQLLENKVNGGMSLTEKTKLQEKLKKMEQLCRILQGDRDKYKKDLDALKQAS